MKHPIVYDRVGPTFRRGNRTSVGPQVFGLLSCTGVPALSTESTMRPAVVLTRKQCGVPNRGIPKHTLVGIHFRSCTASGERSKTTHSCPLFISQRTILAPIRPSPIMPSCIVFLSLMTDVFSLFISINCRVRGGQQPLRGAHRPVSFFADEASPAVESPLPHPSK